MPTKRRIVDWSRCCMIDWWMLIRHVHYFIWRVRVFDTCDSNWQWIGKWNHMVMINCSRMHLLTLLSSIRTLSFVGVKIEEIRTNFKFVQKLQLCSVWSKPPNIGWPGHPNFGGWWRLGDGGGDAIWLFESQYLT